MDSIRKAAILIASTLAAICGVVIAPSVAQTATCGTVTTCPNVSTPVSGTELFYLVQNGVSKKITYFDLAANMPGGYGGPVGGDLTGTLPNPTIKSSVNLTGSPTTTTQTLTDSSTKIATTAFVRGQTVPSANVSFTQSGTGALTTNIQAINRAGPLYLYPEFCPDNTGATNCADAILNWLNQAGTTGRMAYCPAGIYKAEKQIDWNVHAFATELPRILGDGRPCMITFDTGVAAPNFHMHGNDGDNILIGGFEEIGFTCNVNGSCVQIGNSSLLDPINEMKLRLFVTNNSPGNVAIAANFGALYNVHVDGVYNGGGLYSTTSLTISNASPAVVTWTAHGLPIGTPVIFSTTGALPSPLLVNTAYYIITAGYGANSFEVSATYGGSAINTTTSGSGTQSAIAGYGKGLCAAQFNQIGMSWITGSYGNSAIGMCFGSGSQSLYSNIISKIDSEAATTNILIGSSGAQRNRFVGIKLGLSTIGINATAGSDNSVDGVTPGGESITYLGTNYYTVGPFAPLASPTFTGTATFATAPTINVGGIHFANLGTGTNAYALCLSNTGNLVRSSGLTC